MVICTEDRSAGQAGMQPGQQINGEFQFFRAQDEARHFVPVTFLWQFKRFIAIHYFSKYSHPI